VICLTSGQKERNVIERWSKSDIEKVRLNLANQNVVVVTRDYPREITTAAVEPQFSPDEKVQTSTFSQSSKCRMTNLSRRESLSQRQNAHLSTNCMFLSRAKTEMKRLIGRNIKRSLCERTQKILRQTDREHQKQSSLTSLVTPDNLRTRQQLRELQKRSVHLMINSQTEHQSRTMALQAQNVIELQQLTVVE
jgi:hypothetical protein